MTTEAKDKSQASYRPGPAGEATVQEKDGRWTLIFVRTLRHSPEKVWRLLTDPQELRQWAPFDPARDLGAPGETTLAMVNAAGEVEGEPSRCVVRRAERPRLLEYTWEDDLLVWELEPSAGGTRLTLRHTVSDRSWLSKVAAGWQICVDVAERWLDGRPVGRIVADAAKRFDWARLDAEFAARFGVAHSG